MGVYLKNLLSPLEVRGKVYRNRITTAPALMGIQMRPDGVVISTDWVRDKIRHARAAWARCASVRPISTWSGETGGISSHRIYLTHLCRQ